MLKQLRNHRLVIMVGLMLALVIGVAVIGPLADQVSATAEDHSRYALVSRQALQPGGPVAPGAPLRASGADDVAASRALSLPFPGPYPYPPRPNPPPRPPVSGTVRISGTIYVWPYVMPWWCYWPTPLPPSSPPGLPTPPPPTPMPTPTPGGPGWGASYDVCPQIVNKVPKQVQDDALAQPWTIYGYGLRQNPNVPEHPLWNPLRTHLGIMNPNIPYHVCNPVVWKAGCP